MHSRSGRTLVIAEAGVNHNGSLAMASDLVRAAADAGADFCKFQTFRADNLVSRQALKAGYQQRNDPEGLDQHSMLRRLELSEEAHYELKALCEQVGIGFLSTPFDEESACLLQRLGLNILKIPSGELTNLPFLRSLRLKARHFLLSTGMGNLKEVEFALRALGWPDGESNITLLHCTTQYPTPDEDVNLRAMETLRRQFNLEVGLSDHSLGAEASIAAVALGASVIEKHFTLDRGLRGPDHAASMEPAQLKELIVSIRRVEMMLGDGNKVARPSELENLAIARKSIFTARAVASGEALSALNLTIKRPGDGIPPSQWDELIGKCATRQLQADHQLSWTDYQ